MADALIDTNAVIDRVLATTTTWAVVGCSPDPRRDSHGVAKVLQSRGYAVIPIHPDVDSILGVTAYPSLAAVPDDVDVDVVDIFRRSEHAGVHVDEAIARGVGAVWMQLGVVDHEAAARATAAGLDVVMDRCPKIELARRR